MCGILLSLHQSIDTEPSPVLPPDIKYLVSRRGPDTESDYALQVNGILKLGFYASVLHLRGETRQKQPAVDDQGNVLCWNGEIFDGFDVDPLESDTKKLANELSWACLSADADRMIVETLRRVRGPWGLVFYESQSQRLWFGRDCTGRRSLLRGRLQGSETSLVLTSVSSSSSTDTWTWEELVPAIYCISLRDLGSRGTSIDKALQIYPYPSISVNLDLPQAENLVLANTTCKLPNWIDPNLMLSLSRFKVTLSDAVQKRAAIPSVLETPHAARLGILFSGGVDCITLAALASKFICLGEPIDLLNVAFENPRSNAIHKVNHNQKWDVPDRQTGRKGLDQLRAACPGREWRLVEINVSYTEYLAAKPRVVELIHPVLTVMDLSIAIAFYFASRGIGVWNHAPYTSMAKVLFSGLGADEQLGGYGRHRVGFQRAGWVGLIQELQADTRRISQRNLGRDDRIISFWGKEVRYPFLDENVMDFIASLPVWHKCDMRLDKGRGDKVLVRLLARELGLGDASVEVKRAIQFGARTAKMEIGTRNSKGQDNIGD